jgi:diaminohydroxyphosphoribosylaminopyrimidine deaminase/5-amino-6-(5-phosphoribosylamino)uracil reductase
MKLRQGMDAILAGANTILADDPSLTFRQSEKIKNKKPLRRIVLDSLARTPLTAKVVNDECAALTTIVISKSAPKKRAAALAKRVHVLVAPTVKGRLLDLRWLMKKLGSENTRACVTSLLVEGGGETNASFLFNGLAQRVMFFYAPTIMGGRDSRKGVAGEGVTRLSDAIQVHDVEWKKVGKDLAMTATVASKRTWKGHLK